MELVYLWVEDYKNIKQQGFNFSPRFECKFHDKYDENNKLKDNCKLEIKPKKYQSIFPDNINITAIVGENGSGKSNLLSILRMLELIEEDLQSSELNLIIVYRDNTKNLNSYFSTFQLNTDLKKNNILETQYYFHLEEREEYFLESKNFNIHPKTTGKIKLKYKNIIENIFWVSINKIDIELSTFMYIPNKIYVKSNTHTYFEQVFLHNTTKKKVKSVDLFEQNFDEYHKFLILEFLLKDFKDRNLHLDDNKNLRGLHSDNIKDFNLLKNKKLLVEKLYPKYVDISEKEYMTFKYKYNTEISSLTKKEKSFYIKYFEYFIFDFRDEKDRNYSNLSYGERKLFGLFLNIHYLLYQNKENKIFILDEYDLGLHPQWQKNFIKEIIYSLKKTNEYITFILTSHSPFMLSDLPKENVIFLKNGKQVYPLKNDEQTFGANIHTLLSHGFFMQDGLMGEFAKGKIEKIKKFYELVKRFEKKIKLNLKPFIYIKIIYLFNIKKFRHIESIIGEPFLQTVIKNYLDELEIIFNGKKQFLQNEIKRLQELESSL